MPKVVIVGNSGAARECYWIFQDMLKAAPGLSGYYEFGGFLSWKGYPANLYELSHLQYGSDETHAINADELFVIGVGSPLLRQTIYREFKARGAKFMNLIHPWTDICASAVIGEGNIFQRGCTVYCNAKVGDGNYINGGANISHDAEIGNFNFIGPFSTILGEAKIGSCNSLGPNCIMLDHSKAGDRNRFAPGSFLYKGCKDDCRMAGNPAFKVGSAAYPDNGEYDRVNAKYEQSENI